MRGARKTQPIREIFGRAQSGTDHETEGTHNLYGENYGETFEGDTWGEFSRWVLLKPI